MPGLLLVIRMNDSSRRRMRVFSVWLICQVFALLPCHGQQQWNVWHFGVRLMIDFNVDPPRVMSRSAISQQEGSASVSSRTTGEMLFYTDGVSIWNRRHEPMRDISGVHELELGGSSTTTQSALIVPDPGDTNRYHVLTVGGFHFPGNHDSSVYAAIVDMSRGDGEVIARRVVLGRDVSEGLTAVRMGSGCGYWVIGHSVAGNWFYAWPLGPEGFGRPVVSIVGDKVGAQGYMKASADGTRLAIASFTDLDRYGREGQGYTQVFRFDNVTGAVSAPIRLNVRDGYGLLFSPNSTLLYATLRSFSHVNSDTLCQFNLSEYTTEAVNASRTVIALDTATRLEVPGANPYFGAIQSGPDGRLYVARGQSQWLGVITNPNGRGSGCGYLHDGLRVSFDPKRYVRFGLPNIIEGEYGEQPPECSSEPVVENELAQNEPNPVTGSTRIRYRLSEPGMVRLRLYDIAGREIGRLLDEYVPFVGWSTVDVDGAGLSSGVYFYAMEVGEWRAVRSLVVLR